MARLRETEDPVQNLGEKLGHLVSHNAFARQKRQAEAGTNYDGSSMQFGGSDGFQLTGFNGGKFAGNVAGSLVSGPLHRLRRWHDKTSQIWDILMSEGGVQKKTNSELIAAVYGKFTVRGLRINRKKHRNYS